MHREVSATFSSDFDLCRKIPSVRMEKCSKGIVHFDSSTKSVKGCTKAEKEDNMELSGSGSHVDRNHQWPFRVGEQHEVGRRVLGLKQAKLLHWAQKRLRFATYIATAYTFVQLVERSTTQSSNTIVFRFQSSIAKAVLHRRAVP